MDDIGYRWNPRNLIRQETTSFRRAAPLHRVPMVCFKEINNSAHDCSFTVLTIVTSSVLFLFSDLLRSPRFVTQNKLPDYKYIYTYTQARVRARATCVKMLSGCLTYTDFTTIVDSGFMRQDTFRAIFTYSLHVRGATDDSN